MSGEEFEMFLEQLFKRKGYKVERVGHVSDYGADLIIDKDGTKTAVQAKCWKNPVSVKAIQEINTSMAHYSATKAMVVTNSRFTSNAVTLAKENDVELIDRQKLASLILKKQ
jgi:HJR/Mrr/RecB family endonuclease